jgi:uncharacterized protein YfiM (DUF2279 family)
MVLTLAGSLYLAIDSEPMLRRAVEITPANIKRAKQIVDQNDPRQWHAGDRRLITLSQQELDVAVNYLAYLYANGSARATLNKGKAELNASLRPPQSPFIFYFNITTKLTADGAMPRVEDLRIGQLTIPGFVAEWLAPWVLARFLGERAADSLAHTIKRIDFKPGQVTVVCDWPLNPRDTLGAMIAADDEERLRAYQERLAQVSNLSKPSAISLTELLVALFELADVRSRRGGAVAENRAALAVLAFYVNDKPLATILPAANQWPRPMNQSVTLSGREDLAKHFIVSAALAANAGGPLSNALGIYKEMADRRDASGFSFTDLVANRAGTRFGELAAGNSSSAAKVQRQVSRGISEKDLVPKTSDLPESLSETDFKRRFGEVDGPEYRKVTIEIERRIAALPLYW